MTLCKTISAGLVLALSMAAYGCDRPETTSSQQSQTPQATTPRDAAPAANTELKVEDLITHTDRYLGQEVTVRGEVNEVLSPMAFELDEESPLTAGIDKDVLVLFPKAYALADLDDKWLNDEVRVTGTVGKMTVIEVERELGWDLDAKIEAAVEKQGPILIAKKVERVQ